MQFSIRNVTVQFSAHDTIVFNSLNSLNSLNSFNSQNK